MKGPDTQARPERLGVYVQVPFCQRKCTYCNFHTGVVSPALFAPYAHAVCREIRECRSLGGSYADTVYIGGGTPSLLEAADLAGILEAIRSATGDLWEEATLEADPQTITRQKACAWQGAGLSRISMGVQSFNDTELRAAGRMHRREDVYRAMDILRDAGFNNISVDLIAGLPHQTRESWQASVHELIALRPPHVSVYLLEVDEGSRLGKEILRGGGNYGAGEVPSDDAMADFYDHASGALAQAGYQHYEISNWAMPGRASRHNLKYWRRERYWGFGAGAHSFDGARRWSNVHDPAAYTRAIAQGKSPVEEEERVSQAQALNEEFFLGLRQLAGIDSRRLERKYGRVISARVEKLASRGLLERDGDWIRLNPRKLTISNEVFVELMD